jgi:hypothetical protein
MSFRDKVWVWLIDRIPCNTASNNNNDDDGNNSNNNS